MPNCDICAKKLGIFEGVTLVHSIQNVNIGGTITVCKECSSLIDKMRQGDLDAYGKLHLMVDGKATDKVIQYLKYEESDSNNPIFQKREEMRIKEESRYIQAKAQVPSVLVTTGEHFEGFRIIKYACSLSTDAVITVKSKDLSMSESIGGYLQSARKEALNTLKKKAIDNQCNAIIGLSYSITPFFPIDQKLQYTVCITAHGMGVVVLEDVIEK